MSRARASHASTVYVREYLTGLSTPPTASLLPWANHRVSRGPVPFTTWRSTPESIGRARAAVACRAHDAGASDAVVADIRLAVSEACTNAVLHAFITPRRHAETFAVSTAVDVHTFDVWVCDGGRGAVPETPSPGAGMGLSVIGALARTLDIGVLSGGGTQVHMSFSIDGSNGQPDRPSRPGELTNPAAAPAAGSGRTRGPAV